MKKILLLLLLFAITAQIQAQNCEQINDIQLKGSWMFVVYTTILGGIDEYTVEQEHIVEYDFETGEHRRNDYCVNILCTQKNPTSSYCQVPTTIILDDGFRGMCEKAIVSVKVRSKTGGTEENPIFSDYRLIDSKDIPLPYGHLIFWIQLQEITEDSLLYDVLLTTSIIGEWTVEYEEDGSNINVNILATETDRLACICPFLTKISIKKDTYEKAIISFKGRRRTIDWTPENPIFTDSGVIDSKEIVPKVPEEIVIDDCACLSNQLNIANSTISTLQGQNTDLSSLLSAANETITTLQDDLNTANSAVSTLQTQVNTLTNEINALQAALENCSQTGTLAVKAGNMLSIYPNPASGILTIVDVPVACVATVYDLSGRIVMTFALQAGANNVNISSLPAGTYTVTTGNYNGKFIKE